MLTPNYLKSFGPLLLRNQVKYKYGVVCRKIGFNTKMLRVNYFNVFTIRTP